MWDVYALQKQNAGLFLLDQEKAFDSISHEYVFYTLKQFGFGATFISHVSLLYNHVFSIIKVNNSLCAPLTVGRGVRQGCPFWGILYSLCIEPLLIRLGASLPGFPVMPTKRPIVISAYADDVCVMVRNSGDVTMLLNDLEKLSSARTTTINWFK